MLFSNGKIELFLGSHCWSPIYSFQHRISCDQPDIYARGWITPGQVRTGLSMEPTGIYWNTLASTLCELMITSVIQKSTKLFQNPILANEHSQTRVLL